MDIQASQMSSSSFQSISQIQSRLQAMMQALQDQQIDSRIQAAMQVVLSDMQLLLNDPSMDDIMSVTQNLMKLMDMIGAADPEFMVDQLEELKPSKRTAKVVLSEIIRELALAVDPVVANAALHADDGDYHPALNDVEVDPGIAERGHMGEIAGFVQAQHEAINSYNSKASASKVAQKMTLGGHMVSFLQDFSTDGLKAMLKSILDRGINNIDDLTTVLKILGELGLSVSQSTLQDVEQKIMAYVSEQAMNSGDMSSFLTLIETIQNLAQNLPQDIFKGSALGSLVNMQFSGSGQATQDNVDHAAMLGLNIETIPQSTGTGTDSASLQFVDTMAQDMEDLDDQMEGSEFAEAAAGAQNVEQENTALILDSNEDTSSIQPVDSVNMLDIEVAKPHFDRISEHLKSVVTTESLGMAEDVLGFLEKYMEEYLSKQMDQLI